MIATRTFIVQLNQADRRVVVENSLTRERVRLGDLSEVGRQIEHWLASPALERDDAQGVEHASE